MIRALADTWVNLRPRSHAKPTGRPELRRTDELRLIFNYPHLEQNAEEPPPHPERDLTTFRERSQAQSDFRDSQKSDILSGQHGAFFEKIKKKVIILRR